MNKKICHEDQRHHLQMEEVDPHHQHLLPHHRLKSGKTSIVPQEVKQILSIQSPCGVVVEQWVKLMVDQVINGLRA